MQIRDKLALTIVIGYFGSIALVWGAYILGGTLREPSVEAVKSLAQYGSPLLGVVLGYYFQKGGGKDDASQA